MKELQLEQVRDVNGGVRFVVGAIGGGMIYDLAKNAVNAYVSHYREATANGWGSNVGTPPANGVY